MFYGLSWRSSTAEQLICNQQVVGSNPIASSRENLSSCRRFESFPLHHFCFAGIAQLVEREPSKLGVAGSSPVSRSKFYVADSRLAVSLLVMEQPAGSHRLICPGSSVGRARPW